MFLLIPKCVFHHFVMDVTYIECYAREVMIMFVQEAQSLGEQIKMGFF